VARGRTVPYLTNEALDGILSHVHELSAPGSRITAEHVPADTSAI
jgi:O-methyltransferase involved in polyketide biosynthesis